MLDDADRTSGWAVDLACGTGLAAEVLAAKGFQVGGVDQSPQMLAIACERIKGGHFVRGDIRQPLPTHDADVAVCCFDSLNFLPWATPP